MNLQCKTQRLLLALALVSAQIPYLHGLNLGGAGLRFSGARRLLSHSNDTSALLLPLSGRHGAVLRGRNLLRAANMKVDGSVREVGYFYVTMGLGTPSRTFQLIIDTGSTVTYVPCSDCKHCGKHHDEPFDIKASSTVLELACDAPQCKCGSPACQCFQNKCFYARSYAERSSSDGFLLEDVMVFPDVPGTLPAAGPPAPPVRVVFGCERSETGEIFRQSADGILGMGNNDNALQSQLVAKKVIDDTFYLCFGFPDAGVMLLGDVKFNRANEMVYTPLKPAWQTHYYTVVIDSMKVAGNPLGVSKNQFAQGYGAVLDSGTTFTYMPTEAFKAFAAAIGKVVEAKGLTRRNGQDPQYNDICWQGAPSDPKRLGEVFPTTEIVFAGGTVLPMGPLQYLFVMGGGSYCLGVFDNAAQGTLLGGIAVRNVLIQYDRRNNRAGFLPLSSCKEVNQLVTDANTGPPLRVMMPAPPTDRESDGGETQGVVEVGDTQGQGQDGGKASGKGNSSTQAWVLLILALAVLAVMGGLAWQYPRQLEAMWHRLSGGGGAPRDEPEAEGLLNKSKDGPTGPAASAGGGITNGSAARGSVGGSSKV